MDRLEEKEHLARLMDIYGGLLTERQKDFLELHVNEDLSLGEIAEIHSISRQAVHDAIMNGRKSLERLENHLHLANGSDQEVTSPEPVVVSEDVVRIINQISSLITDDLLYDTEPLKRKLVQLKKALGIRNTTTESE